MSSEYRIESTAPQIYQVCAHLYEFVQQRGGLTDAIGRLKAQLCGQTFVVQGCLFLRALKKYGSQPVCVGNLKHELPVQGSIFWGQTVIK